MVQRSSTTSVEIWDGSVQERDVKQFVRPQKLLSDNFVNELSSQSAFCVAYVGGILAHALEFGAYVCVVHGNYVGGHFH